jgi:hypothetical protein
MSQLVKNKTAEIRIIAQAEFGGKRISTHPGIGMAVTFRDMGTAVYFAKWVKSEYGLDAAAIVGDAEICPLVDEPVRVQVNVR